MKAIIKKIKNELEKAIISESNSRTIKINLALEHREDFYNSDEFDNLKKYWWEFENENLIITEMNVRG